MMGSGLSHDEVTKSKKTNYLNTSFKKSFWILKNFKSDVT